MATKCLISVDPGTNGSASVFEVSDKITLLAVMAFGLKANKDTWEEKLRDWCFIYKPDLIVMEGVHAWKRDGRKSAFTFGGNRRAVELAFKFAGRRVDKLPDPKAWQARCGLLLHMPFLSEKERRKINRANQEALAIRLFPVLEHTPGDIYASVLIGYAAALDILTIPAGQLVE